MFTIETPNVNYNGETYGVTFVNGVGQTDNEEVKNILINEFGYDLVKENSNTKASSSTTKKKVKKDDSKRTTSK